MLRIKFNEPRGNNRSFTGKTVGLTSWDEITLDGHVIASRVKDGSCIHYELEDERSKAPDQTWYTYIYIEEQ